MAGKHGDQRAIPDDALPDDYRLLADSPNYLVAASIPPDRDLILRISHLGSGVVVGDGGRSSTKGLVYFQGHERPMILNKRRGGILERQPWAIKLGGAFPRCQGLRGVSRRD